MKDISDELPFEIPATWRWARLGTIARKLTDGTHQTPKYCQAGVPFLSVKDISNGNVSFASCKFISEAEHKLLYSRCDPQFGDILLSKVGTTGIPVLVDTDAQFSLFVSVALLRIFNECVYNKYILNAMLSPFSQMQVEDNTRGVGNKNWVMRDIAHTLIPLPPFAEQKRIVAKIEKLMPLIEEYGKMEETRLQLDADLPAALEKSILQEATQGKLVPQDPNDEPASELLKRIAAERKALIKAGILKRDKGESLIFRGSDRLAYETRNGETACIQDEIPFEIPDSWEWVRLGSVCSIVRGSGIKRSDTTDSGSPCIRYGEIYTTYGYSFQTAKSFTSEFVAAKCHKAHSCDVLCTLTGECKEEIAKATAYLGTEAIAIGGDLARISNHPYNPMLLVYFMFSPFMLSQKADKSNGDIIVHIGKEAIEDLLIPLPPRAEQERIVDKVANLLSVIKSFTT